MLRSRRQFLHAALHLGAAALTLTACDDDGASPPSPYPDAGQDPSLVTTIHDNHGHVLVVPTSDLRARVEKTYLIQGTAEHGHSVTVSAEDFSTLWNEGSVSLMSSSSGHSHLVTIVY